MSEQDNNSQGSVRMHLSQDPAAEFRAFAREAGLCLEGEVKADGAVHWVPIEGASDGTKDGCYVFHKNLDPNGWVQNFSTGHEGHWRESAKRLPPAAQASYAAHEAAFQARRAEGLGGDQEKLKWDWKSMIARTTPAAYLDPDAAESAATQFVQCFGNFMRMMSYPELCELGETAGFCQTRQLRDEYCQAVQAAGIDMPALRQTWLGARATKAHDQVQHRTVSCSNDMGR